MDICLSCHNHHHKYTSDSHCCVTLCALQKFLHNNFISWLFFKIMEETARSILAEVPQEIPIEPVIAKFPVLYEQSMNTVLVQEILRFKPLLVIFDHCWKYSSCYVDVLFNSNPSVSVRLHNCLKLHLWIWAWLCDWISLTIRIHAVCEGFSQQMDVLMEIIMYNVQQPVCTSGTIQCGLFLVYVLTKYQPLHVSLNIAHFKYLIKVLHLDYLTDRF